MVIFQVGRSSELVSIQFQPSHTHTQHIHTHECVCLCVRVCVFVKHLILLPYYCIHLFTFYRTHGKPDFW